MLDSATEVLEDLQLAFLTLWLLLNCQLGVMELDMTMAFLNNSSKVASRSRFLTSGSSKATLGRSSEMMSSIRSGSLEILESIRMILESKE